MKFKDLATPWPFPFVSQDKLDAKLVKGVKGFLNDLGYPFRDLDYVLSSDRVSRNAGACLRKHNAQALFNLMLAAKGCDLLGGLQSRWYGRTTIGESLTSVDVNQILIAHPFLDLKGLILSATDRAFKPRLRMGQPLEKKRLSPAELWFADKSSTIEDSPDLPGYLSTLSDEQKEEQRQRAKQSAVESHIALAALAFYGGHSFSAPNALLTNDQVLGLVDLDCSFALTQSSLSVLKTLSIDSGYSSCWHLLTYQRCLVNFIAPLATLMGRAPDEVAERVEKIIRHIWMNLHEFTDDEPEFTANIRVLLMNVLWNYPEHWQKFGLTAGDMLGVDCTYSVLKTSSSSKPPKESSAMRSFWRNSLIHKDGSGETYAKVALNALGEKHGLFDPKFILRKWGSCNPGWFKAVKDFTPATEQVNFLMRHNAWHYALEKDRLSHLFGEPSARQAIQTYLDKGGNANKVRATTSLEKYPQLLDQMLPRVTKASQVPRLSALATLTPEQIMRLPEKLHAPLLAADLGL